MTMRLDVSVGPVQGFVAQSRRTRDLWGSSYLLSFLSAHAIHGAREAGGRIVQPVIHDDPLYRWVAGDRTGDPPRVGSVPNHFVAEVDGDAAAAARAGVHALEAAWKQVCAAVWSRFLDHASAAGRGTDRIWQRQTRGFWEVTWSAGDAAAGSGLLARRKRWRSHRPPDEPGDKCTVMHDLQELSGYVRAESNDSRGRQDRFWKGVRRRLGPLELRDNERLCAIAFVKRLFPQVAKEALGGPLDTSHWQSTVYIAAVPWLRRAIRGAPDPARRFAETVQDVAGRDALAERRPPFEGLEAPAAGDFARLDANYLHREFLQSAPFPPLADEVVDGSDNDVAGRGLDDGAHSPATASHGQATKGDENDAWTLLDGSLRALYDTTDEAGRRLGPPAAFYALLLADGDRLGRLVATLGGKEVGHALSTFTGRVTRIVNDHDGVTVYAGGDDVLAMLPVPRALACAAALSKAYARAFKDVDATAAATLSAAVLFAQIRVPLGAVLGEARRLLGNVAKEANGRDSLAVGVLKPGGLNCQWVTTWIRRDGAPATTAVEKLTGHLDLDEAGTGLSSALIYRIRDTLTRLCGWPAWSPGDWGRLPAGLDADEQERVTQRPGMAPTGVDAFLRAEILQSLTGRSVDAAETRAGELTDLVGSLLRRARAPADDERTANTAELGVDVLLLARFLADPENKEVGA